MPRSERTVKIGGVTIGGGHPVAIQSMLCCALEDVKGNIAQGKALEEAGCEIVRVTVPNAQGVKLLAALKENLSIPVVADIHYDYKMALESVAAGCHCGSLCDKFLFVDMHLGTYLKDLLV